MENNSRKAEKQESLLDENNVKQYLGIGIACMIIGFALIPIIVTQIYGGVTYGEISGQVGDTIGGIMGPIVGSIGAALSFLAFWAQYQANQKQSLALADQLEFNKAQTAALAHQKEANDYQAKTMKIERFESRLFSMLETHRNNVNEIKIQFKSVQVVAHKENLNNAHEDAHPISSQPDQFEIVSNSYEGRTAFVAMSGFIGELFIFLETENRKLPSESQVSPKVLYEIVYLIFFIGCSKRTLEAGKKFKIVGESTFLQVALAAVNSEANERNYAPYDILGAVLPFKTKSISTLKADTHSETEVKYPFGIEHGVWLGHYFRHLFLMVEYVARQDFLDYDQKYDYVRQIRAQLSNDEQVLLFYNAISVFGRPWEDLNYLKDYCLVRSISPYADFYVNPIDKLGEKNDHGKWIFDALEIQNRD